MKLPTLYKHTKTGAIQMYSVEAAGDTITVTQGQLNGKQQDYHTLCTPKNIGRANETSGAEQALLEAQSKWNKKVKSGYSEDPDETNTKKLPMKVLTYLDHLDKVDQECYASPKLNGCNAIYRIDGGRLSLWSRGGEEYPPIPHLEQDIIKFMAKAKVNVLNGELYIHGEHLQDIMGAVKKPKELSKKLTFHIFDYPEKVGEYHERIKDIPTPTGKVFVIPIDIMRSRKEIDDYHQHWVDLGYEGIVLRNAHGLYQYNVRSNDVFKYKVAMDAEFMINAWAEDKNGHPVFICTTKAGDEFKVKPKGTSEERYEIINNIKKYLGEFYTVEFEMYSKAGIPLKPVGIGLRKCNKQGEPIE